ncbi:hypothetical protein B0H13DRAFT_1886122 [Mycena leptocephala]|nr:hypothetical protein B0H13DRAFT_1886122 [Mycena leptocephala]
MSTVSMRSREQRAVSVGNREPVVSSRFEIRIIDSEAPGGKGDSTFEIRISSRKHFGDDKTEHIGLRFETINMGREMHGIRGAETASDTFDFGHLDTRLKTQGIGLSFGIAETTRFGSDIDPAETEAETNGFGFREINLRVIGGVQILAKRWWERRELHRAPHLAQPQRSNRGTSACGCWWNPVSRPVVPVLVIVAGGLSDAVEVCAVEVTEVVCAVDEDVCALDDIGPLDRAVEDDVTAWLTEELLGQADDGAALLEWLEDELEWAAEDEAALLGARVRRRGARAGRGRRCGAAGVYGRRAGAEDEVAEEEWTLDELESAAEDAELLGCTLDELEWITELLGQALVEEELERAVEEAGTLLECIDELEQLLPYELVEDSRVSQQNVDWPVQDTEPEVGADAALELAVREAELEWGVEVELLARDLLWEGDMELLRMLDYAECEADEELARTLDEEWEAEADAELLARELEARKDEGFTELPRALLEDTGTQKSCERVTARTSCERSTWERTTKEEEGYGDEVEGVAARKHHQTFKKRKKQVAHHAVVTNEIRADDVAAASG